MGVEGPERRTYEEPEPLPLFVPQEVPAPEAPVEEPVKVP